MRFSNINMGSPSLPMVPQWLEMALAVKRALGIAAPPVPWPQAAQGHTPTLHLDRPLSSSLAFKDTDKRIVSLFPFERSILGCNIS